MIEPFLGRLPESLRQDVNVDTFFRELTDWIEQGFRDFRETESNLESNDALQNDFGSPNSNNQVNAEQEEFNQQQSSTSNRTVTIDATTVELVDGQVANVLNAGTALMAENPGRDYRVEIRNQDGTEMKINGNGRLVNGQAEVSVITQYTVRVVQYFIDTDEFGII